jgi:hypothetical protein
MSFIFKQTKVLAELSISALLMALIWYVTIFLVSYG